MFAWLDPRRPLGRLWYLFYGVALAALKFGLDSLVAAQFGKTISPLLYVSPTEAPLLQPQGQEQYWLALWAVALPFMAIGVVLTLRRLLDAKLAPSLALLFFVPFANVLFLLVLAAIPPATGRSGLPEVDASLAVEGAMARAIVMGGVAGGVIMLGTMAVSVYGLGEYGAALFLGSPLIAGFLSARIYMRLHAVSLPGAIAASAIGILIACGAMIAFALEGLVCLLMAAPLVTMAGFVGALIAWVLTNALAPGEQLPAAPAVALLPLLLVGEVVAPLPATDAAPVRTIVEVDAPPDVVFRHVVAFEPLDEPKHWLFRAGVAAPTGATIEGRGVGAVRHCKFTTGVFVEPITVWEPGKELSFTVEDQPEPLEELTLWPGPHPPHLHGYLLVERGQFLLEPLPGGRTKLIGTTWYRVKVFPRPYWRAWSDAIIQQIHRRVLRHIAARAAEDARGK